MKSLTTLLAIITITSCAAGPFKTKEQKSAKYIVEQCFQKELEKCSDVLCEMSSNDVYPIIEQLRINVLACVEESENGGIK